MVKVPTEFTLLDLLILPRGGEKYKGGIKIMDSAVFKDGIVVEYKLPNDVTCWLKVTRKSIKRMNH
jgi:hypothetical protein